MAALKRLAPVAVLSNSYAGKAALGSNYAVTGGIQTGTIRQSTLLPFAEQQQQALRDAFITDGNLAELADGLGTTLGAAYLARAHYIDRDHFTNLSQAVADVIAYANATTATQTYNLPVVYAKTADAIEEVSKLAPEAGYLLTVAFPSLTLDQADQILTETEGPDSGFLDNGSGFGVYSRLNL